MTRWTAVLFAVFMLLAAPAGAQAVNATAVDRAEAVARAHWGGGPSAEQCPNGVTRHLGMPEELKGPAVVARAVAGGCEWWLDVDYLARTNYVAMCRAIVHEYGHLMQPKNIAPTDWHSSDPTNIMYADGGDPAVTAPDCVASDPLPALDARAGAAVDERDRLDTRCAKTLRRYHRASSRKPVVRRRLRGVVWTCRHDLGEAQHALEGVVAEQAAFSQP